MKFTIGKYSSIHLGCRFNACGQFVIGENSTVNQFCHLDNRGGIIIGKNVSISPYVSIITADHDFETFDCVGRTGPVKIEDYAFIGYRSVVFRDVTMQTGSVLGGMSLLTKSTEPYGIYFGIPAKFIKKRRHDLCYTSKYRRLFH